MQVIGLCRFSYPAIGGFQIEHASLEERIAYLYAEDRLEERFQLMETVALPCLREQTDQDFELIIVIGDSLPKQHRERLQDITADIPQVRIHSEPPRKQRQVMKEILNKARRDPDAPCLQFRHDDDDAVSVDFVERLRQTVEDCSGLVEKSKTVAVDFNRGYVAEVGASGIAATEIHRPYYVASLGMYVRGGCNLTIMNFAHEKILRFMPTVTISDQPMFVRTHNGYNDSRQKRVKPVPVTPLTPDQVGEFEARFAIRQDDLKRVFAAD
ncbi:MAG: putative rhamnosyl transferase [Pseudophaeobacter sp. bin_em_oilr2.035]|uniref:Rhamnosyl transferase n=1 Tax=Phaeobacter gallaeciensis TaxID=60890 RepID=A0ABD4XFK1_9RHOB|nr:putative rhamnosyl transferase [Phaeobacter gallaeciensis]MDF1774349.1 putative rhamnosyl transferase [Pseudophaeobacter sp. bin_em_oilr2.035]MDE4147023.1 putative rhamnosyl transferase [Phaeobacter gallaeciensis]MDE4159666.1 putative rhamnosyl transferase [Phaeobacter gallaeciensis]MDE4163887.1 putative rhamnosyl transferase [Phaeobacter gallaeciensis]MDE4168120.1 putative rhamnosyl transferase [Phaeobacter gallaeciensis]